jgi:hypothetical protein
VTDLGRPLVFHVLVVLGALILSALVLVLRRLSRRASLEEAEEVLRAELARCEEEDEGGR